MSQPDWMTDLQWWNPDTEAWEDISFATAWGPDNQYRFTAYEEGHEEYLGDNLFRYYGWALAEASDVEGAFFFDNANETLTGGVDYISLIDLEYLAEDYYTRYTFSVAPDAAAGTVYLKYVQFDYITGIVA